MRTARAVSAGGVVLSEPVPNALVALVARRSARGELQWTLPKGTQETGESITATALREARGDRPRDGGGTLVRDGAGARGDGVRQRAQAARARPPGARALGRGHVSRRLLAVLLAALIAAGMTVVAAGPAGAGQTGPAIHLRLDAVAPVVGSSAPLSYRLAVNNPGTVELRALRVRASLGSPIRTRSELQRLAGDPDATPGGLRPLPSWQPRGGAAAVAPGHSLALEPRSEPLPSWLDVPSPGAVLPLVLQVSAASELGDSASRITTFVIAVDREVDHPLRLSLLVPLHEQSHRNPAGEFVDSRLAGQLAGNGSLGAMAAELARPGAPKVSIMVDPLLIDEATAMGGGWRVRQGGRVTTVPAGDPSSRSASKFLQDLRQAAGRNLPSVFPYASGDLPALVRTGYDAAALAPLLYAEQHLKQWLGPDPNASLAWPVPGAIDAATLRVLDEAGADSVVLDPHLLPT